ncbi:hypothetical protein [Ramlibacter sp. H39-3-26]|uniref:DinB/UmuC family translesion DNA polymerase n=1 Tax=Curvibacter soli TaxID=3031331 RepID=UPI0031F38873
MPFIALFSAHLSQRASAYGVLCRLVHKAAMRLRKQDVYATAMAVGVYGERRHHGGEAREARLGETQDTAYLLQVLDALWHTGLSALPAPKFVSIALHGLVPARGHTPSLFDTPAACATAQPPPARDRARLYAAMDALNRVYGKNTLYFASAHEALDAAPMRIAFNRIPDVQTEG